MVLFRVWLNSSDLGFTTRFWISMTKSFVTMNSFMITEGNENQWIYQWICEIQMIWKLSYLILLRIVVFELFEHWTMLIVFLFLVMIFSKFYSQISEKHDWISNFVVGVLYNRSCPSVHLSFCDAFTSGSTMWIFLWGYFAIYSKKWPNENVFVV